MAKRRPAGPGHRTIHQLRDPNAPQRATVLSRGAYTVVHPRAMEVTLPRPTQREGFPLWGVAGRFVSSGDGLPAFNGPDRGENRLSKRRSHHVQDGLPGFDLFQSLDSRFSPCRKFFERLGLFGLNLLKLFQGGLLLSRRTAVLGLGDSVLGLLHPPLPLIRCLLDLLQGRIAENLFSFLQRYGPKFGNQPP